MAEIPRVAALYDIHGNTPALEAVLAEISAAGVELIVVGGDMVAGPEPRETLALLRALDNAMFISGNADRLVVETRDAGFSAADLADVTVFAASELSEDDHQFLASLPLTVSLEIDRLGSTLFCHGSPRSDEEMLTARTPEAVAREATRVDEGVIVCGHTHMQFDRTVSDKRVVNAGSVGMPFGDPGAHWALLGPDVELRRTFYDREAAAARLRGGLWPGADEFAETNVLTAPTESDAFAFFTDSEQASPGQSGRISSR